MYSIYIIVSRHACVFFGEMFVPMFRALALNCTKRDVNVNLIVFPTTDGMGLELLMLLWLHLCIMCLCFLLAGFMFEWMCLDVLQQKTCFVMARLGCVGDAAYLLKFACGQTTQDVSCSVQCLCCCMMV